MKTDHYQAHPAEPLRSWSMIHDASAASSHWREALNCTPWLAAACSPASTMDSSAHSLQAASCPEVEGRGWWGLGSEGDPGHGLVVDI